MCTESPKLDLSGIKGKKIKVRAGENIYVKIPLSGAPVPTIDWTRNSSKLPDSSRIAVSHHNLHKRISISKFNNHINLNFFCSMKLIVKLQS